MTTLFNMKNGIASDILKSEAVEKRLLVDELVPHAQNRPIQNERVDSLVYNIRKDGLLQPIVVNINTSTGLKEILAGHHRVKAYQKLMEEDSDKYSMIVSWTFKDLSEEEKLTIMMSTNPSYDIEEQDKIQTLKIARTLYDELVSKKQRPSGRRRDWLVATTGFSEWFVRQHDEVKETVEESPQSEDGQDENDIVDISIEKDGKKMIKSCKKVYDWYFENHALLEVETKKELQSWIRDLNELAKD